MFKKLGLFSLTCSMMISAAAHAGVESVIGHDDRVQVADTSTGPYKYIGRLLTVNAKNELFQCTASLIGEDLIITNAHCAFDEKTHEQQKKYIFSPQFDIGTASLSTIATLESYGTNDPDSNTDQDWAIFRLKSKFGNRFGWFGIKNLGDLALNGLQVRTAGYPVDFLSGDKMSENKSCKIEETSIYSNMITHNCDTSGGASGSPLFMQDEKGGYYIVSLHARGSKKKDIKDEEISEHNYGVRATSFLAKVIEAKNVKGGLISTVHVCNKSKKPIFFSHAYINNFLFMENTWKTEGWYQLQPNRCVERDSGYNTTGKSYILVSDGYANSKKSFCVNPSKAFSQDKADVSCLTPNAWQSFTTEVSVSPTAPSVVTFQ